MPIYEYSCPACGPFEELRDLRLAGEPVPCPECTGLAPRAFSLAVGASSSSPAERALRDRAGSGEPRVASPASGGDHARHEPTRRERPWMIGH